MSERGGGRVGDVGEAKGEEHRRRKVGVRVRRLRRARRRRRATALSVVAVLLLAAVGFGGSGRGRALLSGAVQRLFRVREVVQVGRGATPVSGARGVLVAVTREGDPSGSAEMLFLVGVGAGRGGLVLVPTNLVTTVPGVGMERLGKAFGMVGGGAVVSTLRGLLGIQVSHWASVSDADLARVLETLGSITLDVDIPVVTAAGEVGPGRVSLGGAEALAYVLGGSEGELSRLKRLSDVLEAALERARSGPAGFGAAWAGSAGVVSDLPREELGDLFSSLASLPSGSVTTVILPVARVDAGQGEEVFRFDPSGRKLVEAALGFLGEGSAEPVTVLVLNGNGVPESGARVASLLPPGFYVVSQGNAGSFDYPTTMILVSRWDERHLEWARRVRESLGLGEVARDTSGQTVADIVIVVGLDFVGASPRPAR